MIDMLALETVFLAVLPARPDKTRIYDDLDRSWHSSLFKSIPFCQDLLTDPYSIGDQKHSRWPFGM